MIIGELELFLAGIVCGALLVLAMFPVGTWLAKRHSPGVSFSVAVGREFAAAGRRMVRK